MAKQRKLRRSIMALGLATAMAAAPSAGRLANAGAGIVAKAADNEISTYEELVAACAKSGTYTITKSIKITQPVMVTGKDVTLKNADEKNVLWCDSPIACLFQVKSNNRLRIGATSDAQRVILRGGTKEQSMVSNAVIMATDGGVLYLNRFHIYRSNGSGVKILGRSSGYMHAKSGTGVENNIVGIKPAKACYGVVAVGDNSLFELAGGEIRDCSVGGVTVRASSTFRMKGGEIRGCSGGAGDVSIQKWGTETISNGYGGGVFNQGSFEMSGGTIVGNVSKCGGGVYNSGTMEMTGGTILNNSISSSTGMKMGNGIYNDGVLEIGGDCLVESDGMDSNEVTLGSQNAKLNIISPLSHKPAMLVNLPEAKIGALVAVCTGGMDAANAKENVAVSNLGDCIVIANGSALELSKNYSLAYDFDGKESERSVLPHGAGFSVPTREEIISKYGRKGYLPVSAGLEGSDGNLYAYGKSYEMSQDLTLRTIWEPKAFTVSYDPNGGQGTTHSVDTTFDKGFRVDFSHLPSKEGYVFLGWSDDPKATRAKYSSALNVACEYEQDTTLYAVWEAKKVTIRYETAGGNAVADTVGTYDDRPSVTGEVPMRAGYEFAGWIDDRGNKVDSGQTYDRDVVLNAAWKEIPYTIHYDTDGGSKIADTVGSYTNHPAVTFAVPEREGYVFAGWTDEEGNEAAAGASFSKDVTLSAIWHEIKLTIRYDTAGGTKIEDTVGTFHKKPTVTDEVPTRDGYEFIGWMDGEGKIARAGSEVSSNKELKASWSKVATAMGDITITYDTDGGSHVGKTVGNEEKSPTVTTSIPTKDGWSFCGWVDQDGYPVPAGSRFHEDITLKATWEKDVDWDFRVVSTTSNLVRSIYKNENAKISYSAKISKVLKLKVTAKRISNEGSMDAVIYYQLVKKGDQCVSTSSAWKAAKNGVITVENATNCSLFIRAVCNGKSKVVKTDGFSVDSKAPTVTGVKNGKVYKNAVTIRVSDQGSGIKSVKLNGKSIKSGTRVCRKGLYKLVATDKSGHVKTVLFSISK